MLMLWAPLLIGFVIAAAAPNATQIRSKPVGIEGRCSKCYQINKFADPFICPTRQEDQSCRNSKLYRRWKDGTFATRSAH